MRELNPESIFNLSEFFIDTPMIDALTEHLHSWLWNGISGGVITGSWRIGKTKAIRHTKNMLETRSGEPIPAHHFSVSARDKSTVASIFRNLCLSLGMELKQRVTSDQMCNDLLHYFTEAAIISSTNQFVLFVDEFQRLHTRQLDVFAELYDKLFEININLCVIFVGNSTSSKYLLDHIVEPENELIRGRFFTKAYRYHGIRSKSEVKSILKCFDSKISHSGKTTSITKHFAGNKSESWEFSSLSNDIWRVFKEDYMRRLGLKSWGMQYFLSTVKTLLIDFVPDCDIGDKDLLREVIRESIKLSGLEPDLVRAA